LEATTPRKSVYRLGTPTKRGRLHQLTNCLGTLKGEMMPKPRITSEQKEEIRALYASGAFTQVMLADKFGLRQGTISAIVKKSR
jgi:DNA-binding MarR family transcriptional regulator